MAVIDGEAYLFRFISGAQPSGLTCAKQGQSEAEPNRIFPSERVNIGVALGELCEPIATRLCRPIATGEARSCTHIQAQPQRLRLGYGRVYTSAERLGWRGCLCVR
jgi:hypothetical protein